MIFCDITLDDEAPCISMGRCRGDEVNSFLFMINTTKGRVPVPGMHRPVSLEAMKAYRTSESDLIMELRDSLKADPEWDDNFAIDLIAVPFYSSLIELGRDCYSKPQIEIILGEGILN